MAGDVNRYHIRGLLGRGGMAEVFEAQAIAAGGVTRRVALKRLLAGHEADPDAARMFLDEARIASHLHHGAIVALLDYGVLEGQPFQVLELVDGLDAATLRRLGDAAGAPMPAEIALHLTAEVALALHYAHHVTDEAGRPLAVVHRDIKPSNILVSWNGDVKLGDFGIASALVRAERTLDGAIKGTPAYMGPEQLRGEPLDGRADIFALGCTLCALLTGASPLSRADSVARLLRGEELEPDPDLAPEEAAIVATAVRARPEGRFATAGLFAEALGDLLARRLRRSPRSLLLEWLARVRPPATRRAPAPAPDPSPERAPTSSEGARAGSEGARASSEGAPTSSEGARASSEGARAGSEGARAGSEGARASSEGARASSEGARANDDGRGAAYGGSSPVARRARLDVLLGLDLERDDSLPEARRFVTRTSEPRRETVSLDLPSSQAPPDSSAPAPSAPPPSPIVSKPSSRRWLPVGLAVTGLLLVVGVAIGRARTEPGMPVASAGVGVAGGSGVAGESAPPGGTPGGSRGTTLPVFGDEGAGWNDGEPPFSGALSPGAAATGAGVSGAVSAGSPGGEPGPGGAGSVSVGVVGAGAGASSGALSGGPPLAAGGAGASGAPSAVISAARGVSAPAAAAGPGPAAAPGLDPAAAPAGGFVVVRGAGSVGAEIRVNGGSRGFAPKRLELPLGTYSVDLVLKDGRHLGPRVMSVTSRHTRSSPLAWDVAGP